MGTIKSDSQIQQDVIDELKWDTRVDETEVGVAVDHSTVTLTGTVENWAKKLAAQEAAHRVSGVLDVANDLVVKPLGIGKPNDTEIAHAVRHSLEWDVLVPDAKIQSTVMDGGVTLTGAVEYYSQRADAERAVRNLAGVRWVANKIEVARRKLAPNLVRKSIEEALERHAERTAKRVHLEIIDGAVTLSGTAPSWSERTAIVDAVSATPGVVNVQSRIQIQP